VSIRVEKLTAGYQKDVPIINDITLKAESGKITCIIGPNGAGKSTFLKSICRLIPIIRGRIFFEDKDITHSNTREIISKGISYVPQENQLFPKLTVYDNIALAAKVMGLQKNEIDLKLKEINNTIFPSLVNVLRRRVGDLSGGMQKIVAIARGLIVDAKTFILDEPTAGLSPRFAITIYNVIQVLNQNGKTVLLVDQNVREALQISHYCYVFNNGRLERQGDSKNILSSLDEIVRGWLKS